MKNILLVYPYSSQKNLMLNFAIHLAEQGIVADSICIDDFSCRKVSEVRWPLLFRLYMKLMETSHSQFLRKAGLRMLNGFFLRRSTVRGYDLVDFHAYTDSYNGIMARCVEKKLGFDITLWGSDLMRAGEEKLERMRFGFDNCLHIKLSDNLYEVLREKYGDEYDAKARIVYFGNSDLEVIDSVTGEEKDLLRKKLFGDTAGKLILTCGYNGSRGQNHLEIFDAIRNLDPELLERIHVVVPLTYGSTAEYNQRIKSALDSIGAGYTMLESYLSAKENAVLRLTSDIVVNIQDTDALAGSLQDHLYCGGVCVIGSWLRYIIYDRNDVFYIKTEKGDLAENISRAISEYPSLKERCSRNHSIIRDILSWESTIKNWAEAYGE